MQSLFSTDAVAGREGFAYWRDAVCDAYVHLGCETGHREDFRGSIRLERLPGISVSWVDARSHEVERRPTDIARADDAFFLISLQLTSASRVHQHDRTAELAPGDFALYSSIEPYRLALGDCFRQLVVQVPRAELLTRLPNADLLTGRRVCGTDALGRLVSESIVRFAGDIGRADALVQRHMQQTLVDLIATGLSAVSDASPEASVAEQRLLLRTRQLVQTRLGDPDLDRSEVAAAMRISVRRLNEVFAREGTSISGYIRDSRLERIAADLTDPRFGAQSISDVAMRWGMNNLQHFSRLFAKRFGVPARDYRRGARDADADRPSGTRTRN